MKIGIPEYEITYLGYPISLDFESAGISPLADFISFIESAILFNIEKGFKTTVIDVCEFDSLSDFFNMDQPRYEFSWNGLDDLIEETKHRVFFYVPRDYFLGSNVDSTTRITSEGFTKLTFILNSLPCETGIIVRVGSAYGNRKRTMERFVYNFNSLPIVVQEKIMVTNDDRPSLFSVKDLLSDVSLENKIPIVFRSLAHYFNPGGLSHGDAFKLSTSTWKNNSLPLIIHAESKEFDKYGIPESRKVSDHMSKKIPTFGLSVCAVMETEYREFSCVKYYQEYPTLGPVVINKVKK